MILVEKRNDNRLMFGFGNLAQQVIEANDRRQRTHSEHPMKQSQSLLFWVFDFMGACAVFDSTNLVWRGLRMIARGRRKHNFNAKGKPSTISNEEKRTCFGNNFLQLQHLLLFAELKNDEERQIFGTNFFFFPCN